MRIAARVGEPSLRKLKSELCISDYWLWMEFFEWELNESANPLFYYLAQIAAEIRRANMRVSDVKAIKLTDFLLRFVRKQPVVEKTPQEETPLEIQMRANRAKQFFFGLTGLIGGAGKKRQKLKRGHKHVQS